MVETVKPKRTVSQAPIKFTTCHGGCGTQVEYRTTPRVYCPPCKVETVRAAARVSMEKQRRKRGVPQVKGRAIRCELCNTEVILERNAGAKRCPPCAAAKVLDRARKVARSRTGTADGWKYATAWEKRRKAEDPAFAMKTRISKYMATSLRRGKGGRKWQDLVGYTLADLMIHLEKQFLPGMTWDNRGEWHIDHVRPLCSYEFQTPDCPQFREAWALNNLQPLWAIDNIRKGGRWEPPA